jgi:pentatricopeptide repeat protein
MFRLGFTSSRRRRRPLVTLDLQPIEYIGRQEGSCVVPSRCLLAPPKRVSRIQNRLETNCFSRYANLLSFYYQCSDQRWDINFIQFLQSKFEPNSKSAAKWRACFVPISKERLQLRFISSTSSEDVTMSEGWEEMIERLLDVNVYPVGFSNMPQSVALVTSWAQQVSRALQYSSNLKPNDSIEPALKLLDRLFCEQEYYADAGNEDGGILMSPDLSSTAVASALASWKTTLLNPENRDHDRLLVKERLRRYGMFLANHDGSLLSQISKVIDPSRLSSTSVQYAPVLDTPSRKLLDSEEKQNNVENSSVVSKFTFVADVAHVTTLSNAVGEGLKDPDDAGDAIVSSPLMSVNIDEVIQLAVEEWEDACDRLLDLSEFPVGFSNTDDTISVNTWFKELEQLLRQTNPFSIEQAFGILQRWKDEELLSGRVFPISTNSLNWVLECWLSRIKEQDPVDDGFTPEEVWDKVMSLSTHSSSQNETSLSFMIRAIGQVESPTQAPMRAEALLKRYIDEWADSPFLLSHGEYLNNATINSLLSLWNSSHLPEAPSEADRLLNTLDEWFIKYQRSDQIPDEITYASVISIWISGAAPGAAVYRAEVLLNDRQSEPSFVLLGTFIDALAKAGHVDRAHTLLNKYIDAKVKSLEKKLFDVKPIVAFEGCNPILSIFEGYRKRLDRQPLVAMVQMERFVSQLEKLATDHEVMRSVFHPNVSCYNVLVGAYSQLRTPHKAEGLLGHVMRLLSESTDKIIAVKHASNQPVSALFNSVLSALAACGDAESVPRAIAIVKTMETKCRDDSFYQPTAQTYSILLYCIANDRRNFAVENAREATDLLERMERDSTGYMPKPNPDCYDTVLKAWCRAGYPDQAETILRRLCSEAGCLYDRSEEKSLVTSFPTSIQFIIVMQGWVSVARRRNGHHRSLLRVEQLLQAMHTLHLLGFPTKPSITAHNIFLECLAKSDETHAPERAEAFLRLMEKTSNEDPAVVPDVVIFNSVLATWLRSNRYDAPIKAAALFQKMKSVNNGSVRVINATTYTTLMGIYLQNSLAPKVQETFDELMQSSDVTSRVPILAYTILLQAWSLAGKPNKAHEILESLRTEYDSGRLSGPVKDGVLSFNSVLRCYLDSRLPDSAKKAEECLELMHLLASSGKFEVSPDHDSYSHVIKCFLASDDPEAGHRAFQIFERMKALYMDTGDAEIRPDLEIYTDLLSVLTRDKQLLTDAAESSDSNGTSFIPLKQLHSILDEMDGLVNPSCWIKQGEICLSRMAWHFTESDLLSDSEKMSLMFKLRRLADQHSVKLDHSIMLVLKNFRQMESTASVSNG